MQKALIDTNQLDIKSNVLALPVYNRQFNSLIHCPRVCNTHISFALPVLFVTRHLLTSVLQFVQCFFSVIEATIIKSTPGRKHTCRYPVEISITAVVHSFHIQKLFISRICLNYWNRHTLMFDILRRWDIRSSNH